MDTAQKHYRTGVSLRHRLSNYTLCLKKRPTFTTCIIFTYTVRLRQFLAQMLPRK